MADELERVLSYLYQEITLKGLSWGANLTHSPKKPELEEKTADLFLKYQVVRVEASASMDLRPSVVRYAATGLKRSPDGRG